jgi:hypothetical protein
MWRGGVLGEFWPLEQRWRWGLEMDGREAMPRDNRGWGKAWQRLVWKISRRVGGLRSLTKRARTIWDFPCLVELHERVNAFGYLEMVWLLLFWSELEEGEGILIPVADLMRYETVTSTPYLLLLPYTKNK